MNWGPLLEIIVNGRPWSQNMCVINKLANSFASTSIRRGTKCHSLVRQSTTTHMALQPFDQGRPITKSIDMSCQALSGIGRGYNTPNGTCLLSFMVPCGQDVMVLLQ
jgi:hypothetical protein